MAAVADNAMRAGLAYRGAVEDYGNFIDSAMREYGWTSRDASGNYSVKGAQDAFDPDQLIQYDAAGRPTFDQAALLERTSGGQYGTTGLFASTAQAGAAAEAQARAGVRGRGITGGGLAAQQERLAETMTQSEMGGVSGALFSDIMSRYKGLGKAYEDVRAGEVTDAAIIAGQQVEDTSLYGDVEPPPAVSDAPVAPPAASSGPMPTQPNSAGGILGSGSRGNYKVKGNPQGSNKPANPEPGRMFQGAGGITWVYRSNGPTGKGWYKKG
jgi:hypothetical protein